MHALILDTVAAPTTNVIVKRDELRRMYRRRGLTASNLERKAGLPQGTLTNHLLEREIPISQPHWMMVVRVLEAPTPTTLPLANGNKQRHTRDSRLR